jgi:hypothetical protein
MKAKVSKGKPETPSWAPEPARPKCKRCGVWLIREQSIEADHCGECLAFFGRCRVQAQRVNKGGHSLPAALSRRFQIRTGARVEGE